MHTRTAVLCCVLTAVPLHPAAAQQARQHAADPQAATPPVRHSSAFTGYRPLGEEKPAPWRDINDEVARIGGHIGIFRSQASGAAPAAAGHSGHHPGAPK